jgi:hypothetical protein
VYTRNPPPPTRDAPHRRPSVHRRIFVSSARQPLPRHLSRTLTLLPHPHGARTDHAPLRPRQTARHARDKPHPHSLENVDTDQSALIRETTKPANSRIGGRFQRAHCSWLLRAHGCIHLSVKARAGTTANSLNVERTNAQMRGARPGVAVAPKATVPIVAKVGFQRSIGGARHCCLARGL